MSTDGGYGRKNEDVHQRVSDLVPTIDRRNEDDAYYILANPGDRGNITYQVEREAFPILNADSEITPGGDISWPKIKALQAIGVIYTESSGTIYPKDHPAPDSNSIQKGGDGQSLTITNDHAESFFDTIANNWSFTDDQRSEVRRWLGMNEEGTKSPPDLQSEQDRATIETLENRLKYQLPQFDLGHHRTETTFNFEESSVTVVTNPTQEPPYANATHVIFYTNTFSGDASGQMKYCGVHIGVTRDEGFTKIGIVGHFPRAEYPKAMTLAATQLSQANQILVEEGWLPEGTDVPDAGGIDISIKQINSDAP